MRYSINFVKSCLFDLLKAFEYIDMNMKKPGIR